MRERSGPERSGPVQGSERTVHGVTWNDDLSWMEAMKGDKWQAVIKKAQDGWADAIQPLKSQISLISAEIDGALRTSRAMMFRSGDQVEIGMGGTNNIQWKWKDRSTVYTVSDLDARRGGYVWTVEEVGAGAELYAVRLYRYGYDRYTWEYRGIAPTVAVVGGRCYCLEAKDTLVYWRLVSFNAFTGKDYQIHYEEADYRYNLELIRGNEKHAYVRRQSGGKQDCFMISRDTPRRITVLEGISLESRRFVFGSNAGEYLVWTWGDGWRPSAGLRKKEWKFPSWSRGVPEALDTRRGLLVTKWEGCRSLLSISRERYPVTLWKDWGQIVIDPWDSNWVRFVKPGVETSWWDSQSSHRPVNSPSYTTNVKVRRAKSADGTSVPYVLVRPAGLSKPVGLLVVGYGAYGLTTSLMTQRFVPLLNRGWAIAIGLWRGGGDHTPDWEDEGRTHGRAAVLQDAEAVVRDARKTVEIGAARTVLYGRSAGGLWVGGLAAKFPKGDLAGGLYMEVPYLDVLRTTTNRTLPLTNIETDEFGLPEQRLSDFASILQWSPMELMPEKGIPGIWQIVRTSLNDSEVFAYESAKWIVRSRNAAALLVVEDGQGHFVPGMRGIIQQAEDLAVLLEFC